MKMTVNDVLARLDSSAKIQGDKNGSTIVSKSKGKSNVIIGFTSENFGLRCLYSVSSVSHHTEGEFFVMNDSDVERIRRILEI